MPNSETPDDLETDETIEDPTEDAPTPRIDEVVEQSDDDTAEEDAPSADQSLRYSGVDFDVEGLVRRLNRGELIVPTFDPDGHQDTGFEGFQRRFVWPKGQMDRFIDSLLLGYPVPGIFLVELPNRRYLVLDGQQRLKTLQSFFRGRYGFGDEERVFRLTSVSRPFIGRTYESLEGADRRLLENTFISATIIVPRDAGGRDAVYRLFERINSSGIKLQPQEIRVALFTGETIRFIRDLNSEPSWRELFGRRHSRLKDHELILRYLALMECAEALREHGWSVEAARTAEQARGVEPAASRVYRPAMSSFLNHYLSRHEDMREIDRAAVTAEFGAVCSVLNAAGGPRVLRPGGRTQINAAHTDALLVGATFAHRAGALTAESVRAAIATLEADEDYMEVISGSTSHTDSVETRLRLATEAFGQE